MELIWCSNRGGPDGRRGPSEAPNNGVRLTPLGFHNDTKNLILSRFRPELPLPPSARGMSQFGDIWMEDLLSPLSLQPFTREEENIMTSGNFMNTFQKRVPGQTPGVSRSGGRGAAARGGRPRNASDRNGDGMVSAGGRHGQDTVPTSGELGEDESVLWNVPVGDAAFGSFDDRGNFQLSVGLEDRDRPIRPGVSASESVLPGHDRLPPPPGSSASSLPAPSLSAPGTPPVKTPDVTRWLYRDPAGQVQGPFPNQKMIHWYSRNYFPENLPLRREVDVLFEPLSAWKIKLGGVCPFDWVAVKEEQLSRPEQEPARSQNQAQELSTGSAAINKLPSATVSSVRNAAGLGASSLLIPPSDPPKQQSFAAPMGSIFAQLGLPWDGSSARLPESTPSEQKSTLLAEDQLRFLKQFSAAKADAVPSSPSSTAETLSTRGISISLAQLGLTDVPRQVPSSLQSSPALPSPISVGWKKLEPVAATPIDLTAQLLEPRKSRWVPSAVTLSDQMSPNPVPIASSEAPPKRSIPAPKPLVSPLDLIPATSPGGSWSKPNTTHRPLNEIMKEEAEREAARRSLHASSAHTPKSFADTLRAASVSPMAASAESHRPPATIAKAFAPVPPKNAVSVAPLAAKTTPSSSTPRDDLKAWTLAQLKPLEANYDVNMCSTLLFEFKSAAEVAAFVEDNMRSPKMDMQKFTRAFVERRFGVKELKFELPEPVEEEFVTAGRKSRKASSK